MYVHGTKVGLWGDREETRVLLVGKWKTFINTTLKMYVLILPCTMPWMFAPSKANTSMLCRDHVWINALVKRKNLHFTLEGIGPGNFAVFSAQACSHRHEWKHMVHFEYLDGAFEACFQNSVWNI